MGKALVAALAMEVRVVERVGGGEVAALMVKVEVEVEEAWNGAGRRGCWRF